MTRVFVARKSVATRNATNTPVLHKSRAPKSCNKNNGNAHEYKHIGSCCMQQMMQQHCNLLHVALQSPPLGGTACNATTSATKPATMPL